jgi:cephalosporin-C deacetylase-like acetyl esterase
VGAPAAAQESDLVSALQKLDVRIFAADSADAKLRSETLRQLREDVNKKDVEAWRSIRNKADWEKFRNEKVTALRKSLGNFPEPPMEVKVVTTKKLQGEGFTVENIIYESRPNFFVTANLYVPEKTSKPMPGFIIVHSHHNPKTQGELQDMGMNWARQGCLVLVPDMVGHGERRQHPFVNAKSYPEKFKPDRQDYYFRYNTALQLHLVGESLMGWMVWDLMRGLDMLYQRPNLDKSKIVVFGSVAGGGDVCAVLAALDPRVSAAAPFNFGGPQPETKFPLPKDAALAFNYMGGGSWESTRNLKLSARDGFLPWLIVGSIAPRGLIYGHEFAWDEGRDPVWARFQKIWGFYDSKDKLASVKGRGSVRGTPPESTHCNNIGPEHRKQIYPTLKQWFGLSVIETEYKKRFDPSELQCWTEEARKALKPKMVHELAQEIVAKRQKNTNGSGDFEKIHERELEALGISAKSKWFAYIRAPSKAKATFERVGVEESVKSAKGDDGFRIAKFIFRHESDPVLALPVVTLLPVKPRKKLPVVIGIAQGGKAGFLKHRAETIAHLLKSGVAVCLPDLRGAGETSSDGRGRASGSTSLSATELMHGRTVVGAQLQELVMLTHELPKQGFGSIALWGDSFVEPNDPKITFAVPHDAEKMPRQSEPMGGVLALLGFHFGARDVKAVYVRGGMVSFRSMLDSPFCYFPHDAVIPGALITELDIDHIVAAHSNTHRRLEGLVDGLNRRAPENVLRKTYQQAMMEMLARSYLDLQQQPGTPGDVAAWFVSRLGK